MFTPFWRQKLFEGGLQTSKALLTPPSLIVAAGKHKGETESKIQKKVNEFVPFQAA